MNDELYTLVLKGRSYCLNSAAATAVKQARHDGTERIEISALCVNEGCEHHVSIDTHEIVSLICHTPTPELLAALEEPIPDNVVPLFA